MPLKMREWRCTAWPGWHRGHPVGGAPHVEACAARI